METVNGVGELLPVVAEAGAADIPADRSSPRRSSKSSSHRQPANLGVKLPVIRHKADGVAVLKSARFSYQKPEELGLDGGEVLPTGGAGQRSSGKSSHSRSWSGVHSKIAAIWKTPRSMTCPASSEDENGKRPSINGAVTAAARSASVRRHDQATRENANKKVATLHLTTNREAWKPTPAPGGLFSNYNRGAVNPSKFELYPRHASPSSILETVLNK
eukprot:GHVU01023245.1.p1 GENE.GHVU01023245.1~~GHVU01023245.1.p1  ORF type:complete len:227 (-),score=13.96 GHVU01023245.1:1936-2586(-)